MALRGSGVCAFKLLSMNENCYRDDGRSVGVANLPDEMGYKGLAHGCKSRYQTQKAAGTATKSG